MRVLSFDPGAARQGWACLEKVTGSDVPLYHASGVVTIDRNKESYQPYKLRVIRTWVLQGWVLLNTWNPDVVVSEIVPSMGFENSVQNQLAQAAITTVQAIAVYCDVPIYQESANSIKKAMTGNGKASKVKVRNGVFELLPELKARFRDWTKIFEEPDAIATGLTHLGYKAVV